MKKLTSILIISAIIIGSSAFLHSKFSKTVGRHNDASYSDFSADTKDWQLILVNSQNPIPENYNIELTTLSNGVNVDSRIYPDLQNMFDDARNSGIYPIVGEGYRTKKDQENIMNEKILEFILQGYSKTEARELAKEWVAEPGTSEHELGIALDINADTEFSADEDVYQWLSENAYKYGFILRYPYGKEAVTGIDYEPWHYRYVGKEAASAIFSQQITLEEYCSAN